MSERRRFVYPVIATAVTAALGWWLVTDREGERETAATETEASPRYYATAATLRSYTPSGKLDLRVQGKRFDYFEASDEWQFVEPHWRRLPGADNEDGWRGRAERGRLRDEETRGTLRDNVVLTTQGKHGPVRLYTDRLELFLPRDYAETESRVRIKATHWQQSGTGGHFWIAQERFNLLADTEAVYESP